MPLVFVPKSSFGDGPFAIHVDVVLRDGSSPGGAIFRLDLIEVDASIDYLHVNALATDRAVFVESESSEAKAATVGYTHKTIITNYATRAGFRNVPME